jgi:hypothetical protein
VKTAAVAAATTKKPSCLHLSLLRRLVLPSLASLTSIERSGELKLCMQFLIKVVFQQIILGLVTFFAYVLIKIASSTISNLGPSFHKEISFLVLMVLLEDTPSVFKYKMF